MDKKTIVVIFGGCSPEYEVSLKSAYSVIKAINHRKYKIILLGITRQGRWNKYTGDVENIPHDNWHMDDKYLTSAFISPSRGGGLFELLSSSFVLTPVDVVFPVLHGRFGEDGTVQGLCELAGIPVVGSGSAASALCMDKNRSHKLASLAGIRVPKTFCFHHPPTANDMNKAIDELGFPLFVKPVKAGSSIGITKVEETSELSDAIKEAFEYDDSIIVEEYIDGFEVGCAVVGYDDVQTGRVDEIELSNGFFDYSEKYSLKTSKIHMPARISAETERQVQEAAKKMYHVLGCSGYARVDFFLTSRHEIVFSEANTIPGFTSHSRFPNMMKAIGVDYPKLIEMLIELGIQNSEFVVNNTEHWR